MEGSWGALTMRNDVDFSRGCFRVRGDVVEIFPASEDSDVIRVEFFDNTIESIREFDVNTQISLKNIKWFKNYVQLC